MKLNGPDFFEWKGLRRVRRGGLARWEGHYYDHGNPVPGWLIPDIVDGLLEDGLLELGDPDESGMRRVALTEAGLAHYRMLCKRQRRKDLVAPPLGARPPHRDHRDPVRSPVEQEALPCLPLPHDRQPGQRRPVRGIPPMVPYPDRPVS